ncbi:Pre-mRNA-splicing factor 38B [Chionoecetes opilio]|uniref:Pre-mRNA-splicing factor 38 n=1 Tax=Chionoecetes opilio TaxID=41210 RepID=A0A8J4YP32_CHIOP|nr:Pre-mRNA-splicing factor 38B [Chionoecetes opilio]
MNLNPLILTNIQSSQYFKVNLYQLKTYHEVIDEIYYNVTHLEPWEKGSRKTSGQTGMCGGVRGVGAGGIVSTAFCILYKLYTLRLSRKQVLGLLNHADSPYIRGLGFMYVSTVYQDVSSITQGCLQQEGNEIEEPEALSLQKKVKVLARMDAGVSMRAICAEFDIKSSTFHSTRSLVGGLFMYLCFLRFTQPPADLWDWLEAYLDDEEVSVVTITSSQLLPIPILFFPFLVLLTHKLLYNLVVLFLLYLCSDFVNLNHLSVSLLPVV